MRDEPKMDVNRLITEVHKRPALWNQKNVSYHNRDATNHIWMEIAALFKLPKQVLKNKWKGLRDTFRAEIKKEQVYKKSNCTAIRPAWIHFKTLQFLKEQMLPKPPIWERAKKGTVNDESTSPEVSEDSCGWTRDSPLPGDVGVVVVDPKNRRVASIDGIPGENGNGRRAGKRTAQRRPERRDSFVLVDVSGVAATNDDRGTSSKDDRASEAANSRNLRQSDKQGRKKRSNDHRRGRVNNNGDDGNEKNGGRAGDDDAAEIERCEVKKEPADDGEMNSNDMGNFAVGTNDLDGDGSTLPETTTDELMLVAGTAMAENYKASGQTNADPLEGNCFDDNYYFLMSLLPHVRTLSAERCMLLRMQMQQLVYQEVYGKTRSSIMTKYVSSRSHDQRP